MFAFNVGIQHFSWHKDTKTFTIEASMLESLIKNERFMLTPGSIRPGQRDAVRITNPKTGNCDVFVWKFNKMDSEGDLMYREYGSVSGMVLKVWNT